MIKDSVKYKLVSDHLGSIRFVVNANSGTILQELEYSAFGEVLKDTNPGFQPFGYAGGIYDVDTKLVKFGARDYNSFTGRWMQKDPIRFGGGDENLYRYVGNDALTKTDPSGLISSTNEMLPYIGGGGVGVGCGSVVVGVTVPEEHTSDPCAVALVKRLNACAKLRQEFGYTEKQYTNCKNLAISDFNKCKKK
jgi:RHS repeat-associated protein